MKITNATSVQRSLLRYQWPAFLWAIFILLLCTVKLTEIPHPRIDIVGFDKVVHLGFFFVLSMLLNYGFTKQHNGAFLRKHAYIVIFIVATVYGGGIELLQKYFFTYRSAEWLDFYADVCGAALALVTIEIYKKS